MPTMILTTIGTALKRMFPIDYYYILYILLLKIFDTISITPSLMSTTILTTIGTALNGRFPINYYYILYILLLKNFEVVRGRSKFLLMYSPSY